MSSTCEMRSNLRCGRDVIVSRRPASQLALAETFPTHMIVPCDPDRACASSHLRLYFLEITKVSILSTGTGSKRPEERELRPVGLLNREILSCGDTTGRLEPATGNKRDHDTVLSSTRRALTSSGRCEHTRLLCPRHSKLSHHRSALACAIAPTPSPCQKQVYP